MNLRLAHIQGFIDRAQEQRMARESEAKELEEAVTDHMLAGGPFTYSGLCRNFRAENATIFDRFGGDRVIDRTIQKLRKAGKIKGERRGRTFIWRAEEEKSRD